MSQANLEIRRISGHAGTRPRRRHQAGVSRSAKLIDTTTCIGCKACEVACLEWNGLSFSETDVPEQLPDHAGDGLELLEPDQVRRVRARRRQPDAADAQGPVHALRGAGVPDRLPGRRRHRPVHQRHRRFPAGPLHRLRLLHHRLPVQHPQVQPANRARCSSARSARTASARGWSRPASRRAPPAACSSAPRPRCSSWARGARRSSARSRASPTPGSTTPPASSGTHVIYVLHDATNPEAYGGLPSESARPLDRLALEAAAQVDRQPGHGRRPDRPVRSLPALRAEGRRRRTKRSSGRENSHEPTPSLLPNDRVVRYTFRERLMHWLSGFSYLYLLLTRPRLLVPLAVLAHRDPRRRPPSPASSTPGSG